MANKPGVIKQKTNDLIEKYGLPKTQAAYLAAHLVSEQTPAHILEKLITRRNLTKRQLEQWSKKTKRANYQEQFDSFEKGLLRIDGLIVFLKSGQLQNENT